MALYKCDSCNEYRNDAICPKCGSDTHIVDPAEAYLKSIAKEDFVKKCQAENIRVHVPNSEMEEAQGGQGVEDADLLVIDGGQPAPAGPLAALDGGRRDRLAVQRHRVGPGVHAHPPGARVAHRLAAQGEPIRPRRVPRSAV